MKALRLTISLPESQRLFVEERANSNYGSVSEYIRELIRKEQRRELELMDAAFDRQRNSSGTAPRPQHDRFPFRRN